MNSPSSKSGSYGKSFWSEVLRIILNEPQVPPEGDELPHAAKAPSRFVPQAVSPTFEYSIEPSVYLLGHGICLVLCLTTLGLLLQASFSPMHLVVAAVTWVVLTYCSVRMIQGIRYGCSLRVFRGHLEVRHMRPTKVVTVGEVAYFRELNRESHSRRRICLHLTTGQRILLPNVDQPELLLEILVKDLGLQQAI